MFNNEAKKEAKKAEEIRAHVLDLLTKQGNKLEGLSVTFDDGIVTLAGTCDSTKTRDKALLMAKNVEGVNDVKDGGLRVPQDTAAPAPAPAAPAPAQKPVQAPISNPFGAAAGSASQAASRTVTPPPPPPPPAAPQAQVQAQVQAQPAAAETLYTIQPGDSLSKIARQFYGDGNKYMIIFEANKDTLKDPDKIFPGKQIRIPKI